ncbi:MAG: hypothetical protein WC872_00845 [Candidatus Absconditabacterales bacterium]
MNKSVDSSKDEAMLVISKDIKISKKTKEIITKAGIDLQNILLAKNAKFREKKYLIVYKQINDKKNKIFLFDKKGDIVGCQAGVDDIIESETEIFGKKYIKYKNNGKQFYLGEDYLPAKGLENGIDGFPDGSLSSSIYEIKIQGSEYIQYKNNDKYFLLGSDGKLFPGLENGVDTKFTSSNYGIKIIMGDEFLRYRNNKKYFLISKDGQLFPGLENGADEIEPNLNFNGMEYLKYRNNNKYYFLLNTSGQLLAGLENGVDEISREDNIDGKEYIKYKNNGKCFLLFADNTITIPGLENGADEIYKRKYGSKEYIHFQKNKKNYLIGLDGKMFPGLENGFDDQYGLYDGKIIEGETYYLYKDGGKQYGITENGKKCLINQSPKFTIKKTLNDFFDNK